MATGLQWSPSRADIFRESEILSAAESSTWDFQVGRWTYARHMRQCSPPPRPRVRGDPGGGIYQSHLTLEKRFNDQHAEERNGLSDNSRTKWRGHGLGQVS